VYTQLLVSYLGVAKTLALLKRQFYWPRIDKDILYYIANCHNYKRVKASINIYNSVLIPLLIP